MTLKIGVMAVESSALPLHECYILKYILKMFIVMFHNTTVYTVILLSNKCNVDERKRLKTY